MQKTAARRPRFQRVDDLPMRLTERDRTIVLVVIRHRFITTGGILALVPGSRRNIIHRLQRLYHAGYLDRPRVQLPLRFAGEFFELVYSSTQKGVRLIAEASGGTASRKEFKPVTSLFLKHALAVSAALVAIETECRAHGCEFLNERKLLDEADGKGASSRFHWRIALKSGKAFEHIGVIPDAVFAIERDGPNGTRRLFYFLEVDRGTMPLRRKSLRLSSIHRKALAYARTRRNGVLKKRHVIPGFQVLFVSTSEARLERMAEVCREADSRRTFLFITTAELSRPGALARLGML